MTISFMVGKLIKAAIRKFEFKMNKNHLSSST